jgi:cell division protein FtsB
MKRFRNLFFFTLSVILLTYTFFIGIKNIFRYNKLRVQYEKTLVRYESELEKKERFKTQIAQMQSQDFWELQAKSQFGFVKKDEVVYKLVK